MQVENGAGLVCQFGALWGMAARRVNEIEAPVAKFECNDCHNFDNRLPAEA